MDYSSGQLKTNQTFSSYSPVTFASKNEIWQLPVELMYFTATCDNQKDIKLEWATASETNNDFFIVQRSEDMEGFKDMGIVQGAGNSNRVITYTYIDKPAPNAAYYRLKQVDYDGGYSYSEIVSVNCEKDIENSFMIYPNPCNEWLNIMVRNLSEPDCRLKIYNMLGKEILNYSLNIQDNGSLHKLINLSGVQPGMYVIRLEAGSWTASSKFTKQ